MMLTWIAAAWRGRLPLWLTYWVLGVGGNMSFVALLLALLFFGGAAAWSWLWLVYGLSLVWFVFIFGAIWRAAGVYPGRRLWAALARLGVLVGIVRMTLEAVLIAGLAGAPP
ncbi:MAG: hypothetical protein GVY09_11435 [Gammaproteobacteria bacterium]|jgi:hypothetical protein|nr:hypothetical protein [Gammaproteobacteria bacterium]